MQPHSLAGCHSNLEEAATNADAAAGFGGDSGLIHLPANQ